MSDKTTLHKYLARNNDATGTDSAIDFEADGTEDLGAFGWIRGARDRSIMLELRKKTGSVLAIGYSWIERVEFDPSVGITLHMGSRRIVIRGRNLNAEARPQIRLFQGITRQRVSFIQEADHVDGIKADNSKVFVEAIEW